MLGLNKKSKKRIKLLLGRSLVGFQVKEKDKSNPSTNENVCIDNKGKKLFFRYKRAEICLWPTTFGIHHRSI